jgi:hypothetical protein
VGLFSANLHKRPPPTALSEGKSSHKPGIFQPDSAHSQFDTFSEVPNVELVKSEIENANENKR